MARRTPHSPAAPARACAAAVAALLALAPAAPSAGEAADAGWDPLGDLSFAIDVPAGDTLVGVQWDDAPERSARVQAARAWIDYGAPGPDPDLRAWVPFDEGAGAAAADLAVAGRTVEVGAGAWTRGRFGAALALDGAALALAPGAAFPAGDWTFSLWLRAPAPATSAPIAAAEGRFALRLAADGRLVLALPRAGGGELSLRARAPLAADRWTHVAVAVDAAMLHQVRLVVDGEPAWRALDTPLAAGPAGPLRIGAPSLRIAIDEARLVARALSTAALARHARPEPSPGLHRVRLRFASGRREEREPVAGVVRGPSLAGAALARGALRHATASDEGLRWAPGAWERIAADDGPRARTAHPIAYVGDHRALVFGGEVRDTHAPGMVNGDDTWLWDLAARRWQRVGEGPRPSPRCHLPAAWSPDHDLLLVVGGWFNGGPEKRVLDDAWAFRPSTGRWQRLASRGTRLPRQSDAGLVYHAGLARFLLFTRRATYEYDPAADRWARRPEPTAVDESGAPATLLPVISPVMGYDPVSGAVVRFGGAYQAGGRRHYTDQTVLFDAGANRWTVLRPAAAPGARVRSGFAYDTRRRRFVLFGGVRDQFSDRFDDLWTFDPAARRWQRVLASGAPSARGGYYGMAYDPELDAFALLLGRHAPERFLDEAWHLRLDEAQPGRAAWVFDRRARPEAERLHARGVGAGVAFAFAGSADGLAWSAPLDDPAALGPAARFVRVEARLAPGGEGVQLRELGLGSAAADCGRPADCRAWALPPLDADR
jgi:hypothetical protein